MSSLAGLTYFAARSVLPHMCLWSYWIVKKNANGKPIRIAIGKNALHFFEARVANILFSPFLNSFSNRATVWIPFYNCLLNYAKREREVWC